MTEYYYNVQTAQVEEGPHSPADHLMGPYATREDASRALEIAQERNEKWDEEDRAWDED
ncbi:MAG: SPOR domain-containing protein [Dermabacter sp.]|nr:SPOR domain-containing protein [Dermabacter sp.]